MINNVHKRGRLSVREAKVAREASSVSTLRPPREAPRMATHVIIMAFWASHCCIFYKPTIHGLLMAGN